MPTEPPPDAWPEETRETLVAPAPPPPPEGPPPDRRIGAGMLLGIGAVVLVALGFLITWLLIHRHHHHNHGTTIVITTAQSTTATIKVPDVRGMKVAQARSTLHSLGLGETERVVSANGKPAGSIVDESPSPGAKVTKGTDILISVARTPPAPTTTTAATTTAPTTTTATTTTVATTTQATTTTPATTSSAPPQPTTATVPDLTGQQETGAAQALGRAGLLASLVFVPSSDPLGAVEGQGKAAGSTVPYHSHVQVNLSQGPGSKPQETVPDVVGKTLQDAVAAMQSAHLRLIYLKYPVSTKAQAGKIVQQSPLANAHAPENAQVLVYLGAFKAA